MVNLNQMENFNNFNDFQISLKLCTLPGILMYILSLLFGSVWGGGIIEMLLNPILLVCYFQISVAHFLFLFFEGKNKKENNVGNPFLKIEKPSFL